MIIVLSVIISTGHVTSSTSVPIQQQNLFHSNTTSPDSGASLSPRIEAVDGTVHHRDGRLFPPTNQRAVPTGSQCRLEPAGRVAWCYDGTEVGVQSTVPHNVTYPGGNYAYSPHLVKPYPTGPLQPHPAPARHPSHFSPTAPVLDVSNPPIHHTSAFFSPTQKSFAKSRNLSVNNLYEQQRSPLQTSIPATPLTATLLTAPHPTTFVYCDATPFSMQHHTHQHSGRPEFNRSLTLLHGPKSLDRHTKQCSFSHDNLLDLNEPTRKPSAFKRPQAPAPHTIGRQHCPDNHEQGQRRNTSSRTKSVPPSTASLPGPGSASTIATASAETSSAPVCCIYDSLSSVDMLDLLLHIGSPQCKIQKLE